MEIYYWFWGMLVFTTLAWYSTVTVFVAYKGVTDIRTMLKQLNAREDKPTKPVISNSKSKK